MLKHFYTKTLFLFAVLTMMWGGNVYGKDDPGTLIDFPIYNYSPGGNPFKAHIKNVNWDKQYIKIVADLSSCTSTNGSADCIFSLVGTLVADGTGTNWNNNGAKTMHVYYSGGTTLSDIWINTSSGTNQMSSKPSISDKSNVVIEISKANGMVVNGVQSAANGTLLADIFTSSNVTFSSEEGNGRMHGTYKSVTLEKIPSPDASFSNATMANGSIIKTYRDSYNSNGSYFCDEIDIDWNTQKLLATVDLTNCTSSDKDFFAVTTADGDFTNFNGTTPATSNMHWYTGTQGTGRYVSGYYAYSNSDGNWNHASGHMTWKDVATFELSKANGLLLNGNAVNNQAASDLEGILAASKIKVGIGESGKEASAVYTIQVVTADYSSGTSATSSNVLKESMVNTFDSQSDVKVQLDRTFSNDGWYTFCVPFAVDADMLKSVFGEGVELRTFKDMSGITMNFEAAQSIEAGVPYLLKVAQEVSNPVFDGVNVVAPESNGKPAAKGDGGYYMQGVYGMTALSTDGTNLFLGGDSKFYKPSAGGEKMKGMRAYFVVPQGTNMAALVANIDGEATAINQINDTAVMVAAPVYNLNGQCVGTSLDGLARGIYVQNGKKYVVK